MTTIIVMIILAASVVITLSNTGIIGKAEEAVDVNDLNQVQQLASLIWAEAYIDKVENIDEEYIREKLEENGVITAKYDITVTENGVIIEKNKASNDGETNDGETNDGETNDGETNDDETNDDNTVVEPTTLGSLITSADDYGKEVNYVSDNGVTGWKVFYKQTVGNEEYVYLIASEKLAYDKVPSILSETVANGGAGATVISSKIGTLIVGAIYWSSENRPTSAARIQNPTLWMAKWANYNKNPYSRCVSYFLNENLWSSFKNTKASYKDYVKGAIGTPTAEMFVASWNAKREIAVAKGDITTYNKKLALVSNVTTGYYLNDITSGEATSNTYTQDISTSDSLYIWSTASAYTAIYLASPTGNGSSMLVARSYRGNDGMGGRVGDIASFADTGVRPVVCLSSKIPASVDANGNFVI